MISAGTGSETLNPNNTFDIGSELPTSLTNGELLFSSTSELVADVCNRTFDRHSPRPALPADRDVSRARGRIGFAL